MEAGDKFTRETVGILRPEPAEESARFGLRGTKLHLILGGIVLLAILAVVSNLNDNFLF